jgi:pimeloyl-ACP methyl ester carboxylesterase
MERINAGLARVDKGRLYYEMRGQGRPLVLIGGGASLDRRAWDEQFAEFSKHYKVIRYDIRGIGKSSKPTAPFSHSRDLFRLLKFLGIDKAALVGLSFGSAIAIDFTLEHPEMVSALVAAAPGLSSSKAENLQAVTALASVAAQEGDAHAIELIVDSMLPQSQENIPARQKVQEILSDNTHVFHSDFALISLWQPVEPPAIEILSEITTPTLLLIGDRDFPDIQANAEKLGTSVASAKKIVIPGAGHIVNLEKPAEFNRAVLDFLGEN